MGIAYGVSPQWMATNDKGRKHAATKASVQDGLVLNLDAGVKESYNGSSTTWSDLLSQYDATFVNMNNSNFSKDMGGILLFDGTDEYLTTNMDLDFQQDDFTLSAWVYPKFTYVGYGRPIMVMGGSCVAYDFALEFGRNAGKFSIYTDGGTGGNVALYSSSSYIQDQWYHASVTRIKNSINDWTYSLYINGASDGTKTGNYNGGSGGKFTIGKFLTCSPVNEWFGNIAGVQVYNRALTAAEVSRNFNVMRHRFGI